MKPILTNEQKRMGDSYTIEKESISSIDLMERAAKSCCQWIIDHDKLQNKTFYIVCGSGNNGGDGAAIARILYASGRDVEVFLPDNNKDYSKDLLDNIKYLPKSVKPKYYSDFANQKFDENVIIIDAILGSGLSRPIIDGEIADMINRINQIPCVVISIDLPSGLFADKPIEDPNAIIIHADYTLTIGFLVPALFYKESEDFVGVFVLIDIDIHPHFINEINPNFYLIDNNDISFYYNKRRKFSHKGNFGHCLCIGGSEGKMGSVGLMSKGTLVAGSGLCTALVDKEIMPLIQIAFPEVMAQNVDNFNIEQEINNYNVIGIGPGLGITDKSKSIVKKVIENYNKTIVFDADAINILAQNQDLLDKIPENSILTPHFKEFERIAGKIENSYQRIELLKNFCSKYKVFVVLKGAYTLVCNPSGVCFVNPTGNPGMATAGSGDVLTGVITGLLSQGYTSEVACIIGTYIHGRAGDIAALFNGYESVTALNILQYIGSAYKEIYS